MREIRQRFWLRFSTWITLSACFGVLIAAAVGATNMVKLLTLWGDDIQITAYLGAETADSRIAEIESLLRRDPRAGKIEFVGRERALNEFRAQLASYAPDLAGDDDLLSVIPASFQISLSPEVGSSRQVETIRDLASAIGGIAGIEEVRYGQEWVKKYAAVVTAAHGAFAFLGAVLLVAAFFVIGNAVRASIDSRRNEIEVLELVGATQGMIRKPFLAEGAILGFASSATALIAGALLFGSLREVIAGGLGSAMLSRELTYLSPTLSILFLAAGAGLGALSSYLCVRRINTGFAAAGGVI